MPFARVASADADVPLQGVKVAAMAGGGMDVDNQVLSFFERRVRKRMCSLCLGTESDEGGNPLERV